MVPILLIVKSPCKRGAVVVEGNPRYSKRFEAILFYPLLHSVSFHIKQVVFALPKDLGVYREVKTIQFSFVVDLAYIGAWTMLNRFFCAQSLSNCFSSLARIFRDMGCVYSLLESSVRDPFSSWCWCKLHTRHLSFLGVCNE